MSSRRTSAAGPPNGAPANTLRITAWICPDSAKGPETGIDNVAGRRSGRKIDLLEGNLGPIMMARFSFGCQFERDSCGRRSLRVARDTPEFTKRWVTRRSVWSLGSLERMVFGALPHPACWSLDIPDIPGCYCNRAYAALARRYMSNSRSASFRRIVFIGEERMQ